MRQLCECGRPAIVRPKGRRRSKTMKRHPLCERCFRDELNRTRPKRPPKPEPEDD